MTYLPRTLVAVLVTASLPAIAQEATTEDQAPGADLTCAEYLELDDSGRTAAMEAMAVSIGIDAEAADEETTSMHLADLNTFCETSPDMDAMEGFQQAMDNPG